MTTAINVCRRGHDRSDPANAHPTGECKPCRAEREARYRARKRGTVYVPAPVVRTRPVSGVKPTPRHLEDARWAWEHKPDNEEWRLRAACRGTDPDIWHPVSGHTQMARSALTICADCPVRNQCLADALTQTRYAEYGIRGGRLFVGEDDAQRTRAARITSPKEVLQ